MQHDYDAPTTTSPMPDTLPAIGSIVLYTHGDETTIGQPLVDLPLIVCLVDGSGGVGGQAFLPPGTATQIVGPDGKVRQIPVQLIPVFAQFALKRRAGTWRWPDAPIKAIGEELRFS